MSGMQVYYLDVCSAFLLKMLILFCEAPGCFEYLLMGRKARIDVKSLKTIARLQQLDTEDR